MSPEAGLALFILGLVAVVVMLAIAYEYWKRDYRSVTWARLKGPVWAKNYSDDEQLLIYCLHRTFLAEREKWQMECWRASPEERHRMEAEDREFFVVPAFVFARGMDEGLRNKLGIGRIEEDAFFLRDQLVHRVTGYWPHQMSEDTLEKIYNLLIPLEEKLYIPYRSSSATLPPPELVYQQELSRFPARAATRFLLDPLS